ncbi:Regulatory protein cys-3 [Smittium mucronatum]|uniref:Regulatory protein cys-3 n=1 Tax=Smittium mucronatum TaxID=133383 RepID=A0A1R0GM85_9FUNG|nr:Regulatory protein cys-3 [Smittium mucronatum]
MENYHNPDTIDSIKALQGYIDSGFISTSDLQNELEFWSKASVKSDSNFISNNEEVKSVKISNPFVFNTKKQKSQVPSNEHNVNEASGQDHQQKTSKNRSVIDRVLDMNKVQSRDDHHSFFNQDEQANNSSSPLGKYPSNFQFNPSENAHTSGSLNQIFSQTKGILGAILSEQYMIPPSNGTAHNNEQLNHHPMEINNKFSNSDYSPPNLPPAGHFHVKESNFEAQDTSKDSNQSISAFVESHKNKNQKSTGPPSSNPSERFSKSTIQSFMRIKEAATRLISEISGGQVTSESPSSKAYEDSKHYKKDSSSNPSTKRKITENEYEDLPHADPESSDLAAEDKKITTEEERRRRNTAASARFRVKKKLKEQMLEQRNSEMSLRLQEMEKKIKKVTMENRWLKSIVVEKEPNSLITKGCPCHHPNGFSSTECLDQDDSCPTDFDL